MHSPTLKEMEAQPILSTDAPSQVFRGKIVTKDDLKQQYRELTKKWHPDVHKEEDKNVASAVMTHINLLYVRAQDMLDKGVWEDGNSFMFTKSTGEKVRVNYLEKVPFELGYMYICQSNIFFMVYKDKKKYYDNYIEKVQGLKFANTAMEEEFTKYIPILLEKFETDEFLGLRIAKPQGYLYLKTVHNYFEGKVPEKHVAWVMSSMYNIACFLHYNKLAHNGMIVENIFMSPEDHNCMLLGGWWYATYENEKMLGAPRDVVDIMSTKTKTSKLGTYKTDMESLRLLGRSLLGSKTTSYFSKSTLPKPLVDWVTGVNTKDPYQEYSSWMEVAPASWGKREFTVLDLDKDMLYKS